MTDEPRLVLAPVGPLPGWLLAFRQFLRKTRRGWQRLYYGCWARHSFDLLRKPQADGSMDLECPRCDLIVRTIAKDPAPRIRPWDEKAHQRSLQPKKDNISTGRFTA